MMSMLDDDEDLYGQMISNTEDLNKSAMEQLPL